MCEVLLSYLSFEDKIRFECVSKQFQRLIFNKQHIIDIQYFLLVNESINIKVFESVLKKCKFINNIIGYEFQFKNEKQFIELIIKYCNDLKSIQFCFNAINDDLIEKFGNKFGHKLKEIKTIADYDKSVDTINKYKKLLRLCPNLVSIESYLSYFVDENELLLTKLSKLKTIVESEDIKLLKTFVNNYKNSLTSISLNASFYGEQNENELIFLMQRISELKNLKEFELEFESIDNTSQLFINNFRAIGFQCNQLKSFKLVFDNWYKLKIKRIYDSFNFFKNLNYLDLNLDFADEEINEISCQSLKELKLLMNLKLQNPVMNDIFFKDIDKHLPQLKHLDIMVDNNQITDKALNSLSKLSKLKTLRIDSFDRLIFIAEEKLLNVINNCPQINSIRFERRPNITHKTIDALIALALRKPRIQYNHYFYEIEKEFHFKRNSSRKKKVMTAIDLQTYEFANNLNICTDSQPSAVEDIPVIIID